MFRASFGIIYRQTYNRKYTKTVFAEEFWRPVGNCLLW